jgi:hypothetical protein
MRLKRKIAPFVFGVTIGLLAGVGFFIFKINDWFTKLRDTANDRITVIEQPVKNVKEEPEEKKPPREKFKIDIAKTSKVNYREVDSLIKHDSRINIATDQLLSVKNVKVIKIADNPTVPDSASEEVAHPDDESGSTYQVEFWKTPLNSKGYRFSRTKVMLYGFPDFSNVLLYELGDGYYLRSADQVFKLNYTAEFRQPEKVTDPDLLAKLN